MLGWRLTTGLLVVWTLAMGAWLVAYQGAEATCGPEIYRDCQIGVRVFPGLGRPGIVLLWSLGVGALALTWATTRPGSMALRRTVAWLPRAATLAAVVVVLAAVVGYVERPPAAKRAGGVRVDVLSAAVQPRRTPSGELSDRARMTVDVRISNRAERAVLDVDARLLSNAADPIRFAVRPAGDATIPPILPGLSATHTLRFETAAAATRGLLRTERAVLQIAGEAVPLDLIVSRPVAMPPAAATESRTPAKARRGASVRRQAALPAASRRPQPPPAPPRRVQPPLRSPRSTPPPPQPPAPAAPAPRRRPEPPRAPSEPGRTFDDSG